MNVPAIESMSSPETPKSQSLMTPCFVSKMFDGLISRWMILRSCRYASPLRTYRIVSTASRIPLFCTGVAGLMQCQRMHKLACEQREGRRGKESAHKTFGQQIVRLVGL